MKTKCSFRAVTAFFITIAIFLPSLANAQAGLVDFRALVVLHPRMADYDINTRLFKVRSKTQVSPEAAKKLEAEILDLNYRLHQYNEQLLEYQNKFEADMKKIEEDYRAKIKNTVATATLAYEGMRFTNARDLLKSAYQKNIAYVNGQISSVSRSIKDKEEEKKSGDFVGHIESGDIKKEICKEVKEHIAKIAKEKRLSLVFNSSVSRKLSQIDLQQKKDVFFGNLSYKDALYAFYVPFDHSSDPVHSKMDPEIFRQMEETNARSYYANVASQARRWLGEEARILEYMDIAELDNQILFGGVDITADVLRSIFSKYSINPYVTDSIVDILK